MSTNVYRAIVSQADSTTGDIKVRIPAKFGPETTVNISRIGRKAYNGVWTVPEIGEQVVVTADDEAFTNIFWLQTDVTSTNLNEILTSIETLNSQVAVLSSQVASINTQQGVTVFEVLDIFS